MKVKLGPLIVDERARCVTQGGERLEVSRKGVELLIRLGQAAGQPVRRDVLVRELWPERAVGDKTLSMLVVDVRRRLASYFADQEVIGTVPGTGYSLTVPYEPMSSTPLPGHTARRADGRLALFVPSPSLLSPGTSEFGACLRDTLLTKLGSEAALEVSTREPSHEDVEGRTAFVIHSSVRIVRGDVLFGLRCVTPFEGTICWAASEQAALADAFDAETRLCESLRDELRVASAGYWGRQPWRHYRQSSGFSALSEGQRLVSLRTSSGLKAAFGQFRQALALDPGCAPALVGMADCEILGTFYEGAESCGAAQRATAYVERALALNPDLAVAHSTRGFINLSQLRFASAEHELLEAIRLDGSSAIALQWYADFLSSQGCMREAVRVGQLAVALAPQNIVVNSQLGQLMHMAGRFDEAQAQLERTVAMDADCAGTHCFLALNEAMAGDPTAMEHGRRAVELSPETPFFRGVYGSVLARFGERERAQQQLHKLEAAAARSKAFAEAAMMVTSALGQSKRAIEWFRVATADSAAWALYAAALPILSPIREQSSFQALVRGRGLAPVAS